MGTPIATKPLGFDTVEQLQKRFDVWGVNIDAKRERITVSYEISLLSPAGNPVKIIESGVYERFNSKKGDINFTSRPPKPVTIDNLKFDELRASQVGQMIAGMISLDIAEYTGPESLEQIIYTDPQKEE